jgi:hypothetical protein
LAYREQGYPFPAIAKQMKISISTAHAYVVEGLNLIPLENAKQVLALELKRLDGLLAAHYPNAIEGDVAATNVSLNIIHRRSQLLGLYPEYGKMAAVWCPRPRLGSRSRWNLLFPPVGASQQMRRPRLDSRRSRGKNRYRHRSRRCSRTYSVCGAGGGRNEGPNPHDTFVATFDMQEVPINQGFPLSLTS